MFTTERIVASISIFWTIVLLLSQWASARGTGRKDYSVGRGSPWKGILYNFTYAMLPAHKESIRLYPFHFTVGVLMHIGVFIAILKVLLLLIIPNFGLNNATLGFVFIISAACALFLLLRRAFTKKLRMMSSLDDYLSILLVIDFLIAALLSEFNLVGPGALLINAAVLFFYLPLGKLKHAMFFFIARTDYGSRLGYRGTYPACR